MEKEASKKESEYNQEMGEEGNYLNLDFMYTTFYDSDPDIPYEYEPYISFDKDGIPVSNDLFETMDEEVTVDDAEDATILPPIRGHVEFKNVSFGYDPAKLTIKSFSEKIKPELLGGIVLIGIGIKILLTHLWTI